MTTKSKVDKLTGKLRENDATDIYDRVFTGNGEPTVLASDHEGETWWNNSLKAAYLTISAADSTTGAAYWQNITQKFDPSTNGFCTPQVINGAKGDSNRELWINAINNSGDVISALSPQVMISQPAIIEPKFQTVTKAIASDIQIGDSFGLSTTGMGDVGDARKGFLSIFGYLNDVDTTGTDVGEVWVLGQTLYSHPSIPGAMTNVQPLVNIIPVCQIEEVSATTGKLFRSQGNNKVDASILPVEFSKFNFTGDEISAGLTATFYELKLDDIGTVLDVNLTASVPDNSTAPFELSSVQRDWLTTPSVSGIKLKLGERKGQLQVEKDSGGGQEKYHVEVYEALPDGTPISSEITGQDYSYLNNGPVTVGDLGFEPIGVYHSKLEDKESGDDYISAVFAQLGQDYFVQAGNRLRAHALAEKVGSAGPTTEFTLYGGKDRNSFLETPAALTSDDIANESDKLGSTVTEALNNSMGWQYPYIEGTYPKKTQTHVDGFLCISNATTSDYPAPTPIGTIDWLLPEAPAWSNLQHTGYVESGIRIFNLINARRVTVERVWIPNISASAHYRLFTIDNNTGIGHLGQVFDGSAFSSIGWKEFNITPVFVVPGDDISIVLQSQNSSGTTDFNHPWVYTGSSNQNIDPGNANANKRSNNILIRINDTDRDAISRAVELNSVIPGTIIRYVDEGDLNQFIEFEVIQNNPDIGWHYYDTVLSNIGSSGEPGIGNDIQIYFEVPVANPTDYVELTNFFFGDISLRGVIELDNGGPTYNDNAYGVDIKSQEYTKSPDWDVFD